MIWILLIGSIGLASAEKIQHVEPEYLDELRASGQDEKLAELLGVRVDLLRQDDAEQRSEGSMFNHASYLGDIVLTDEQERNALNFNYYTGSRWPNGRIPYVISSEFTMTEQNFIRDAIAKFNAKVTNLKIVPRQFESDYVYIINGNGCYSSLGRRGGQQVLSLQKNGCISVGTVHHEFIHAGGFLHEQNRPDRDNYVKVLWENIPATWQSQYEKVSGDGWILIGDYDYYSIMHYAIWAPETYKDAFALPPGVDRNRLGHSEGVTNTDVYKINELYRCV